MVNCNFVTCCNENADLKAKNAELQKQVDELKEERYYTEQDTAKEIFTDLLKEFSIRKSCGNADVVVREMATRKGVEVE